MRTYVIFWKNKTNEPGGVFSTSVQAATADKAVEEFVGNKSDVVPVAWTEPATLDIRGWSGQKNGLHPVYPVKQPAFVADDGPLCGGGLR